VPSVSLPARALEVIVELRVLELREVERGGVPHEAHAHAIGEQVAEQRLHERRGAREELTGDDDTELDAHDVPQRRQ